MADERHPVWVATKGTALAALGERHRWSQVISLHLSAQHLERPPLKDGKYEQFINIFISFYGASQTALSFLSSLLIKPPGTEPGAVYVLNSY